MPKQGVFAQEVVQEKKNETIVVAPTFQEITLEESTQSAQAKIQLTNNTSIQQQFVVFPVDISQIDANGNIVLSDKPLAGSTNALSGYIKLYPTTLQLSPGESKEVDVTIYNVQNLGPGGHYAALVARSVPSVASSESNQTILPALSSFLLVRKKGGERYHLSLKSVEMSNQFIWWSFPKTIDLSFENQGNVHTTPRGQIQLVDIFKRTVVEGTINDGSKILLPQSVREFSVTMRQIRKGFPVMLYNISVSGRSDPGEVPYQTTLTVFYLSKVGLIFLITFILFLVSFFIFRKKFFSIFNKIIRFPKRKRTS